MCKDCLHNNTPDRNNICEDAGAYIINYAGCKVCGLLDMPREVNRKEKEESKEEIITFSHVCDRCEHLIANHEWTFSHDDEKQYYEMDCGLCGMGSDETDIF